MKLRYGLDELPPWPDTLLFGLQWLAVSVPGIVILGKIVGAIHFADISGQIIYLQKLYFVTGLSLFCQVMWGHRLPLVVGPSTVLLIGVIACAASGINAVYSSLVIGGLILFVTGISGLFGRIRELFTPRVVASLLLLIALTLSPTVIRLVTAQGPEASVPQNLCFAVISVIIMFLLYRRLKGIWRSTLILWSMAGTTIAYLLIFPRAESTRALSSPLVAPFFRDLTTSFSLEPGVLISFLFCFFALSVNDISSIQSISSLLEPRGPSGRINRGLAFTGLGNVLSGFLGVIGPVNFSLSPGVIMASGCASRIALIPAAAGLVVLSFSPWVAALISAIPPVVVGTMFIYILCYQIAAGLMVAVGPGAEFTLESGLTIGLSVLLGTIFSFFPHHVIETFPALLRPLMGNGFVIGVLTSLVLEHLVFTGNSPKR